MGKKQTHGGGWQAIRYTLRKAREVGPVPLWRAMRSKNACKTCAVGMGGQSGGMANEAGHFPEVCKKSLQAMVADMQGRIDPTFFSTYSLAQLEQFSSREFESLGRIVEPLVAGPDDTRFRSVSWDEAMETVVSNLAATPPDRSFYYSSGRSSNEAGFLLQLLARCTGTNNVSNCSFYCHQASGIGLKESIGSGTSTVSLDDLDECDLLFVIGGNPASNHPRLMTKLMQIRRRGGRVIVVNPLRETGLLNFRVPSDLFSLLFGSDIASTYLQPKVGGDLALFAGIAKSIVAHGGVDRDFVESSTEGFEELRDMVQGLDWAVIEGESGLGRETIEQVAREVVDSERTIYAWAMGITHHEHGVENVQWIANLALLRGMVGKPGAGLMPIRGHSNVQGLGTIGVTPEVSKAVLQRMEEIGLVPPSQPGLDTLASLESCGKGEKDFALCLGGNLFGASPDSGFCREALGKVGTVVYLATTLNLGHVHGRGRTTVILPVLARDEDPQSTTQESMFNFVRLSDGGPRRHEGPRSEVAVLSEIGRRVVPPASAVDWATLGDHDEIRRLVARLVPGLEQIGEIGESKKEFHIPGRLIHEQTFKTPSGRARLRPHPIPVSPVLAESQLRLMTIRSEGQFNTVVYEDHDIYRGQDRRDVVLMNSTDIERMGLAANRRVDVSSDAGVVKGVLVRPFDIAVGCAAMYFPEANAVVKRAFDPRSKTPAFKSVVVEVSPSAPAGVVRLEDLSTRPIARPAKRQKMKAC